jgi:hypothetical protein
LIASSKHDAVFIDLGDLLAYFVLAFLSRPIVARPHNLDLQFDIGLMSHCAVLPCWFD